MTYAAVSGGANIPPLSRSPASLSFSYFSLSLLSLFLPLPRAGLSFRPCFLPAPCSKLAFSSTLFCVSAIFPSGLARASLSLSAALLAHPSPCRNMHLLIDLISLNTGCTWMQRKGRVCTFSTPYPLFTPPHTHASFSPVPLNPKPF